MKHLFVCMFVCLSAFLIILALNLAEQHSIIVSVYREILPQDFFLKSSRPIDYFESFS